MRAYDQRFHDLPAWAKEELKGAQEEIDRLLATVARLVGKEQTTVSIRREDAGGEQIRQFIPEGTGVDFDLPNGSRLTVKRDVNSLRVTEGTDTSQIVVVPQTTGVINIGVLRQK
jgi:hypothetical protein